MALRPQVYIGTKVMLHSGRARLYMTRYVEGVVFWWSPTAASEVGSRELVCRAPSRVEMGQGTPCNCVDGCCNTLAYRRYGTNGVAFQVQPLVDMLVLYVGGV